MSARRIVPCLDVSAGRVVKGVKFQNHQDAGDIVELARRYGDDGADELVFYDIKASARGSEVESAWISRVAAEIDIPFCVAGGIRCIASAERILQAGADKISINSPALERPELIDELATRFGSQCVVVGIDSLKIDGHWWVHQYTGEAKRTLRTVKMTLDWVHEAQQRGAGEIVLNCMGSDGVRDGYDLEQLQAVRSRCNVSLIASGGAGRVEDFVQVFELDAADAALAASVFHGGQLSIGDVKQALAKQGFEVRL